MPRWEQWWTLCCVWLTLTASSVSGWEHWWTQCCAWLTMTVSTVPRWEHCLTIFCVWLTLTQSTVPRWGRWWTQWHRVSVQTGSTGIPTNQSGEIGRRRENRFWSVREFLKAASGGHEPANVNTKVGGRVLFIIAGNNWTICQSNTEHTSLLSPNPFIVTSLLHRLCVLWTILADIYLPLSQVGSNYDHI